MKLGDGIDESVIVRKSKKGSIIQSSGEWA